MQPLRKRLDALLLDLAWSLWTELGVAGTFRNHQKCLIFLEELILLTVVLAELDPRLRDESLDWCSEYHRFVSISRLKSLIKDFGTSLDGPFSIYSATLNRITRTSWPIFQDLEPLTIQLSGKSCLKPRESPALLNIRARGLFGTGARADFVTFFLTHKKIDFSASDVAEIGYTKRGLAELMEELCEAGLLDKFSVRNQLRYQLSNKEDLRKFLAPLPDYAPSWRLILQVLLPIRDCIHHVEKSSMTTKVVEIRNLLINLQNSLERLNLIPPPFQNNFEVYWRSFEEWLIEIARQLSQADFPHKFYLVSR